MGRILDRTIHSRANGIDLDLRLAAPMPATAWRRLQAEVRLHRASPVPGTLGPIEVDGEGRGLRLGFPAFDVRTTRLDSVLERVRGRPVLAAGLLARARAIAQRLEQAGRSPDVGSPSAILVHPEGRVAVLGIGTPLLRSLFQASASAGDLETQLARLAAALGVSATVLPPSPAAADFGLAWRAAVEGAEGLRGPEVLQGASPELTLTPASAVRRADATVDLRASPAARPRSAPSPLPPDRGPSRPAPGSSRPSDRPSAPKSDRPSAPPLQPELAALAAASPEAQMAALKASEKPLRAPSQGVFVTLALLLIGVAFVLIFRTHQGFSRPESRELGPPVPRPMTGPGFQPPPPSVIGRPPGAAPSRSPSSGPGRSRDGVASKRSWEEASGRPATADLLSITSVPSGATVRLEGEVIGKTPLVERRALEDRSYEISLQMPGYRPWSERRRPDPATGALSANVRLRP